MRGRVRDDHDFTDRLIRGRLPHPPGKDRGLVLLPTRDAAHHGMPDQHPCRAVEVVNPVVPRGEPPQRLSAVRDRKTGLVLMVAFHEDHAVECFTGGKHLQLGTLRRG